MKLDLLVENKARVKSLKKRAKELALSINAVKQQLDQIRSKPEPKPELEPEPEAEAEGEASSAVTGEEEEGADGQEEVRGTCQAKSLCHAAIFELLVQLILVDIWRAVGRESDTPNMVCVWYINDCCLLRRAQEMSEIVVGV